jgi:hypothetical protein
VIATTDESKAFYWLNLVQSGGVHWSKAEAIADPETVADPQTETTIAVVARDRLDNPVPDGAEIELATTQGTFPGGSTTVVVITAGGQASTTLTVGPGDTLADQILDEDGGLEDAIDLWVYASDDETPDDGLTYTIDNMLPAGMGPGCRRQSLHRCSPRGRLVRRGGRNDPRRRPRRPVRHEHVSRHGALPQRPAVDRARRAGRP